MKPSPLNRRRLHSFRANRRGRWSLWVFTTLFIVCLFAEFVANDRPLLVKYDGHFYCPTVHAYPETTFGGEFATEADYRDPYVVDQIKAHGWMVMPLIPFSYDTVNYKVVAPSPPSTDNWLGTDDQGRDVVARLIYGFRISVLFGLVLTVFSSAIGIAAGAVQGYFGGLTDLALQRFIEIWSGMPQLYLLIIMASIITPGFWTLLILMLLFSWMSLVGLVRAEFYRVRNFDFIRAAKALGVGNWHDHAAPSAAQCADRHHDHAALYPGGIDHHVDQPRFPRLRHAARIALAGRADRAGQEQSDLALAGASRRSCRSRSS